MLSLILAVTFGFLQLHYSEAIASLEIRLVEQCFLGHSKKQKHEC